jgi:hypothetical protein
MKKIKLKKLKLKKLKIKKLKFKFNSSTNSSLKKLMTKTLVIRF